MHSHMHKYTQGLYMCTKKEKMLEQEDKAQKGTSHVCFPASFVVSSHECWLSPECLILPPFCCLVVSVAPLSLSLFTSIMAAVYEAPGLISQSSNHGNLYRRLSVTMVTDDVLA
ncbi:hypothetical protein ILYODFUR_014111 [Ilyodon furcidens]|uniref:Uncharacterized protein n=1 Tax=Ilyodon furcidens TaxID=33524 RepID=A0ABV0TUH7_9TELE